MTLPRNKIKREAAPIPKNLPDEANEVVASSKYMLYLCWFLYLSLMSWSFVIYLLTRKNKNCIASQENIFSYNTIFSFSNLYMLGASFNIFVLIYTGKLFLKDYSRKKISDQEKEFYLNKTVGNLLFPMVSVFYMNILAFIILLYLYHTNYFQNSTLNSEIGSFRTAFLLSFFNHIFGFRSLILNLHKKHDLYFIRKLYLKAIIGQFGVQCEIKIKDRIIQYQIGYPHATLLLPTKMEQHGINKIATQDFFKILRYALKNGINQDCFKVSQDYPLILNFQKSLDENFIKITTEYINSCIKNLLDSMAKVKAGLSLLNNLIAFTEHEWQNITSFNERQGVFITRFKLVRTEFKEEFIAELKEVIARLIPNANCSYDGVSVRLTLPENQIKASNLEIEINNEFKELEKLPWKITRLTQKVYPPSSRLPNNRTSKSKDDFPKEDDEPPPPNESASEIEMPKEYLNINYWKDFRTNQKFTLPEVTRILPIIDDSNHYTNEQWYICLDTAEIYKSKKHGEYVRFLQKHLRSLAHSASPIGEPGFVRMSENTGKLKSFHKNYSEMRAQGNVEASFSVDGIQHKLIVINNITQKHRKIPYLSLARRFLRLR